MLTWIYWLLVLFLLGLTLWSLYKEKQALYQANCVMVIIVLLLRILGIK